MTSHPLRCAASIFLLMASCSFNSGGDVPEGLQGSAWRSHRDVAQAAIVQVDPERALAIAKGLMWLAAHQDDDGKWSAASFAKHDPETNKCDGPGSRTNDSGATSLALLAFLSYGSTLKAGIHHAGVA